MADRSSPTIHHYHHHRRRPFLLLLFSLSLFLFSCFFLLGPTTTITATTFQSSSSSSSFSRHFLLPIGPTKKFFSLSEALPQSTPTTTAINSESKSPKFSKCESSEPILKVYMYDLPPEFHFGLLGWTPPSRKVWPELAGGVPPYPGGLNLQHSIEYWLTLDLLASELPGRTGSSSAIRVSRNKELQEQLVKFLTSREEWKRSGGRDHVVLAHHPNSMLDARSQLWPCMLILADFGRYPPNVANVEKDVIAPYKHVVKRFENDSAGFDDRPTLLYFQGAIYRKDDPRLLELMIDKFSSALQPNIVCRSLLISRGYARQELFYLLKDEKDVHFSFGSVRGNGIHDATKGMHSSKFCLNIAGDTPSSNRLFDAIACHCVPVIISDQIELPYEAILDYSKFCIFVRTSDALQNGFLIKMIRGISKEEWTQMYDRLKEVDQHFELQFPSQKDDAVQMIWQAIARKVPALKLKVNRGRRFSRYESNDKPRRYSKFDTGR